MSLQRHVYTLTQTSKQTRQLCISSLEQSSYVTSQRRVFESHRATYVTSNITDLDHNQQRPDQILPATAPANQQRVLSAARSISSSLHFSAFGLQQLVTDSASYDQISARSTKHMLAQRLCLRTRIQDQLQSTSLHTAAVQIDTNRIRIPLSVASYDNSDSYLRSMDLDCNSDQTRSIKQLLQPLSSSCLQQLATPAA